MKWRKRLENRQGENGICFKSLLKSLKIFLHSEKLPDWR